MSAKTLDIEEKTIDVAIERACREFGVGREKLNIEIISEGSNGFLGIGAKKAKIRASLFSFDMDFSLPEAARTTQVKLDGNVRLVEQAASGIGVINESFEAIVETATVIGEKVRSITDASTALANNIGEISSSTKGLDEVVQANAANAEESASAAEELSAQAHEIAALVLDLVQVVQGDAGRQAAAESASHLPERK